MATDLMRYDQLAREALRGVVRLALEKVVRSEGMPGGHHFFITFKTRHPGVMIPSYLREQYPDEMTIVLKSAFSNLEPMQELFRVTLSFQQRPERVTIPYAAIHRFVDPCAQFGLEFDVDVPSEEATPLEAAGEDHGQVVRLDAFRKP